MGNTASTNSSLPNTTVNSVNAVWVSFSVSAEEGEASKKMRKIQEKV